MLNISLLTTDSIPLIGGISDYLHNLLSASRSKINWSVYSTIPKGDFDDSALPYPMARLAESRRLGKRWGDSFILTRKMNTLHWKLNRSKEAKKLIQDILQKDKPDYIAIGRWCEQAHYWCKACRRLNVPYILFAYGWELTEQLNDALSSYRAVDYRLAGRVISISNATTETVLSLGVNKNNIVMVHPGVNPEKLKPLSEKISSDTLSYLGLNGEKYILAMGRLVKRKGFDLAIEAFADIAKDFPDITLVIAGDGEERENLEMTVLRTKLNSRIRILGEVSEQNKIALLQNCEFFVMFNKPVPGNMEGFGIVFLEAGMFGKAVIGGNNGGVPDAVVDGETGILVDTSGSVIPLTSAMRHLLNNPSLASQIGNNGYRRAVNDFDWERIASMFIKETA